MKLVVEFDVTDANTLQATELLESMTNAWKDLVPQGHQHYAGAPLVTHSEDAYQIISEAVNFQGVPIGRMVRAEFDKKSYVREEEIKDNKTATMAHTGKPGGLISRDAGEKILKEAGRDPKGWFQRKFGKGK